MRVPPAVEEEQTLANGQSGVLDHRGPGDAARHACPRCGITQVSPRRLEHFFAKPGRQPPAQIKHRRAAGVILSPQPRRRTPAPRATAGPQVVESGSAVQ